MLVEAPRRSKQVSKRLARQEHVIHEHLDGVFNRRVQCCSVKCLHDLERQDTKATIKEILLERRAATPFLSTNCRNQITNFKSTFYDFF